MAAAAYHMVGGRGSSGHGPDGRMVYTEHHQRGPVRIAGVPVLLCPNCSEVLTDSDVTERVLPLPCGDSDAGFAYSRFQPRTKQTTACLRLRKEKEH